MRGTRPAQDQRDGDSNSVQDCNIFPFSNMCADPPYSGESGYSKAASPISASSPVSTKPHSATPAQYTEGTHAAPGACTVPPLKSVDFWYLDGNVVIKAESNYYKLHSSHLAQCSAYFGEVFADDIDDYENQCAKVEGCPVYHNPTDLDSDDFEKLLAVLETPLYVSAPGMSRCVKQLNPSQHIYI